MLKVVILSPSKYSLYTLAIAEELIANDIDVKMVVVKNLFNIQRLINEIKNNPFRFVYKIFNKLLFRNKLKDNLSLSRYYNEKRFISRSTDDLNSKFNITVDYCNDFHSEEIINNIKKTNCDLIVFTGGGIIRKSLLDIPKYGILNCHMGVLPEYRGMDCFYWALLKKDFENIGLTTHFMDSGIDTGNILDIEIIKFKKTDNFDDIEPKLEYHMPNMMVSTIKKIAKNKDYSRKQEFHEGNQYFVMQQSLKKIAKNKFKLRRKK